MPKKKGVKIIAIVGMAGSGKTVAADFFRSKKIPVLRFGDQTEIGLKEFNQEINPENERWYREKLRKELGMAAYAVKIEPRIISAAKNAYLIALDGLYSFEEYGYLKNKFAGLLLLCIFASPKIRYQRLQNRKVRRMSPIEAAKRDIAELMNLNKGGPIALADYLIKNESSKKAYQLMLEKFWKTYNR